MEIERLMQLFYKQRKKAYLIIKYNLYAKAFEQELRKCDLY